MINATVVGNIGKDAELRSTPGGTPVTSINIASNSKNKDGEKKTTWVKATFWGKQAEGLAPYLIKGTCVAVAGDLELRTWEGNDGKQTTLEMPFVKSFSFCGGSAAPKKEKPAESTSTTGDPFDEDIPF